MAKRKTDDQNRNYKSALANLQVASILNGEEFVAGHLKSHNDNRSPLVKKIKSFLITLGLTLLVIMVVMTAKNAHAASRIKDIVYFEGVRENTLLGYGLVVGLNGTGDNLKNSPFTEKGLSQFLSKLGINASGTKLKTKNVAAVTVTANLPPFARSGSKFDVEVSTMGDAKSIAGGVLLASPLLGADGNVYAVAQGPITIGELVTRGETSNAKSNGVPTSGLIPNGAMVERETEFALNNMKELKLSLRNPDVSTARRISENINESLGEEAALAMDPGTVKLKVPEIYGANVMGLLSDIEQIVVEPDEKAKIVVDEASGTIVMGEEVKISTVAVAQGNLMVSIDSKEMGKEDEFSSDIASNEATGEAVNKNSQPGNGFAIVSQGASLRELVRGLNALGVGTRDLVSILQSIKLAGALNADIEVR